MILVGQPYGAEIKTTQNQDTYGQRGTEESAPRGQESGVRVCVPDEGIAQAEAEIALNCQSVYSVPDKCLMQPATIVHRQTEWNTSAKLESFLDMITNIALRTIFEALNQLLAATRPEHELST